MDDDELDSDIHSLFRANQDSYPYATNFSDLPELAQPDTNNSIGHGNYNDMQGVPLKNCFSKDM